MEDYIQMGTALIQQYGMSSIPNEILGRIFELSCDRETKVHLKLAHVSRRFRSVARDHSQLWTHLSSSHSMSFTRLQLSLSKNCALDVSLICSPMLVLNQWECNCLEFARAIVPYCDKWQSFDFLASHHDEKCMQMHALLRDLHVPALRKFNTHKDHPLTLRELHNVMNDALVAITWKMPGLQTLCGDDKLFDTGFRHAFHLKHLNIVTGYMPGLLMALQSTSVLQFLNTPSIFQDLEHLAIEIHRPLRGGAPNEPKPGRVVFPRLRKFVLTSGYPSERSNGVGDLMQYLDMPNIEEMDFNVTAGGPGNDTYRGWLPWMCSQRYDRLTNVRVHVTPYRYVSCPEEYRRRVREEIRDVLENHWREGGCETFGDVKLEIEFLRAVQAESAPMFPSTLAFTPGRSN